MVLVEHPPGAAPAFRSKVELMVADIDDRIDEVSNRMPGNGRIGYNNLSVPGYGVIPANNVHLPPVAVSGNSRSKQIAGIHVDADSLVGASLEVHGPVVAAALEDGLSDEVNMGDDAVWIANHALVRQVTNGVVIL